MYQSYDASSKTDQPYPMFPCLLFLDLNPEGLGKLHPFQSKVLAEGCIRFSICNIAIKTIAGSSSRCFFMGLDPEAHFETNEGYALGPGKVHPGMITMAAMSIESTYSQLC